MTSSPMRERLLEFVYSHFRATAEWPTFRNVDRNLDHDLDPEGGLRNVCLTIGDDVIICEAGAPDARVKLRLRGVAECAEGAEDISNFLKLVRYSASRDKASTESSPAITIEEFMRDEAVEQLAAERVFRLAQDERFWSGGSLRHFQLDEVTGKLAGVATLDEYESRLKKYEESRIAHAARLGEKHSARVRDIATLKTGAKPLRRRKSPKSPARRKRDAFVSRERLAELRAKGSSKFDLRRLVRLCEEADACYAAGYYVAVATLTRAILDHVPPLLGHTSFSQVASNYGGKSFKDAMSHLENGARKIGDFHLHQQARVREVLPTATQVNFSRELDVLLGEIVRVL